MNDLGFRDWTHEPTDYHRDDRPVDRDTRNPQKLRPSVRRRWGVRLFMAGAFLLLAAGIVLGAWRRHSLEQDINATAEQERDFVPSVRVAMVKASPAIMSVTLPATTAAFAQAEMYARATGYIAKRYVDIGDRVKQDQLLAELAVPEQNDQISQNLATLNEYQSALAQAQANLSLAQVTWDRDGRWSMKAGRSSNKARSMSRL